MLLTEQEIDEIAGNCRLYPINFARKIESAVLDKLKAQEPYALEVSEDEGDSFELVYPSAVTKYNMFAPDQVTRLLYEHPLPPDDVVVRDAERYRWLRKVAPNMFWDSHDKEIGFVKFDTKAYLWKPEVFDEAIDAAMKEMK